MNYYEMIRAAQANYDVYLAACKAVLKAKGNEFPQPPTDTVATLPDGTTVGLLCTDGRANGKSRNVYRYNWKINGKRCKEQAARDALAPFDFA